MIVVIECSGVQHPMISMLFIPYRIETSRFLRLNERNVDLVAICAVILVMQKLSSEATTCPDTMMRHVHQRAHISVFFFFVVVTTNSSIDMYCT